MKLAHIAAFLVGTGIILTTPLSTRAEEITLKDGQKIIGTIVGYEKDMFRIETDFGVALVRKDKVVSIQVTKPEGATAATPAPRAVEVKPAHLDSPPKNPAPSAQATTSPAFTPPITPPPVRAAQPSVPPSAPAQILTQPQVPAQASSIQPVAAKSGAPAPVAAQPLTPPPPSKPSAPPPPPVSHPLDVPVPTHLQEHLDGNTYTNDTFQFSMYKPPDWKIYEGVPKETGSGIMAMGTEDEQTLLMIDRQLWSGTPKLTGSEAEAKLRQTYQEYQLISEEAFKCDGKTAMRRSFTGILEGAEWHGVAVHVIEGNMVFGITGLTAAETYQFQEAIFNKIFKTFHFETSPTPPTATAKP